MSKFWHVILHALAIGSQYATVATSIVPEKYKPVAVAATALSQAILALRQHGAGATDGK